MQRVYSLLAAYHIQIRYFMGNSWKEHLLKSSLPLEYIVGEVLEQNSFHVCGEYSYLRTNESGIEQEFSVDIRAFELLNRKKNNRWWGTIETYIVSVN